MVISFMDNIDMVDVPVQAFQWHSWGFAGEVACPASMLQRCCTLQTWPDHAQSPMPHADVHLLLPATSTPCTASRMPKIDAHLSQGTSIDTHLLTLQPIASARSQ